MQLHLFSSTLLLLIFLISTIAIWVSGIKLTKAIDAITAHFDLGEAFGGMVFLAIVTNLPEIAITAVAAFNRDYDIAISNLLGGIAIQTVVLVLIDIFGVGRSAPLTERGHSKILIVEGVALIFVLCMVLIASQFPNSLFFARSTPFEWIILAIWLGTIYLTSTFMHKKRTTVFKSQDKASLEKLRLPKSRFKGSIRAAYLVLLIGAVITLIAGWALEVSGEQLAIRWGMSGVLFGGTILALCTALPEISTGIASAKIRDYNMAVSDIFGGNAFLPVLFLMASFIGGDAILPNLKPSDIYLTVLGIILTGIYMIGMVVHSKKQIFRMGIDSFIVVVVYLLGLWGLIKLV
jgi:cation:H+ antiporter